MAGWWGETGGSSWESREASEAREYQNRAESVRRLLHGCPCPRSFRIERFGTEYEPLSRPRRGPEFWRWSDNVEHINPEYDPRKPKDDPYRVNCGDCARCFEATWRGYEVEAAGCTNPWGEPVSAMEEWAGEKYAATSPNELRQALKVSGHGSSAIVVTGTETDMQTYNVVNHEGQIFTVDAQCGDIYPFSGRSIHPRFEDAEAAVHEAMGWDEKGQRIL